MDIAKYFTEALKTARKGKSLTAAFHSLVLIHADELEQQDPLTFCRSIGLTDAYETEFRKMMSAAKMLRTLGYSIKKTA